MNRNLNYRALGLSHQSELVIPTSANRLTSFITLYGSELHSSGGGAKLLCLYNNRFFQVYYPLNPMSHE